MSEGLSSRPINNLQIQETLFSFIRKSLSDSRVYIHFTRERSVSEKIMREGFRYSDSFDKTAAELSPSKIDIKYKYQLYRDYGSFLIVICIPLKRFDAHKSGGMDTKHDTLYNLGLSELDPREELEYQLAPKYVLGYIDLEENRIYKNENYSEL